MSASAQTMQDLKACQNAASDPDRAIPACTAFIRTGRTVNGQALPVAARSSITFLRGWAHFIREEGEPSIADFTAALASNPSQATVLTFRGYAHLRLKDFSSGMADLNRAVEIAGQTKIKAAEASLGLRTRAVVYLMQHDFDRALSDVNKAIAVNPKDGYAYFTRAELEQYRGEDEKANADYASAMKLAPADAKMFAGYKEFEGAWRDYLKDIQDSGDYANWSGPPLELYRNSK
jgi:tetratricopeptide (TPR) repeat protein